MGGRCGSVAGNTTVRVRGGNQATPTLACSVEGASAGESERRIHEGLGETKGGLLRGRGAVMEGETNFGLREDVVNGDHGLGRALVIEVGGQPWPSWGIVNGQLDRGCGNRDARSSLL